MAMRIDFAPPASRRIRGFSRFFDILPLFFFVAFRDPFRPPSSFRLHPSPPHLSNSLHTTPNPPIIAHLCYNGIYALASSDSYIRAFFPHKCSRLSYQIIPHNFFSQNNNDNNNITMLENYDHSAYNQRWRIAAAPKRKALISQSPLRDHRPESHYYVVC
jgi:hypothetical protein